MNLIKTTFLSGISTVIKIISGFIITKAIAVFVGPSGMAVIGQLQNFINMLMLGAGDFLKTAVTKYTAEYEQEAQKKYSIWSNAIKLIFFLSTIAFIPLFFFSQELSMFLLKDVSYSYVFKTLSFSLPLFVLNTFLLSILNGRKQIQKYVLLQIVLSITSLLLVVLLSVFWKLEGALLAYVINQSVVFFITVLVLRNEIWFKLENFSKTFSIVELKKLLNFAVITFMAVISSNVSLLFVRDFVINETSMQQAGYWQGIWALSQVALSFITVSLTTYYLPTLSSLSLKSEINMELKRVFKIVVPVSILIFLMMYLLRNTIIEILYTVDFMSMESLFFWQMIGCVVKVCAWLFGYVLVAKAMVKYTVSSEFFLAITFVLLSILCVKQYGIIGMTYAYCINAILHLLFVVCVYIFKLK